MADAGPATALSGSGGSIGAGGSGRCAGSGGLGRARFYCFCRCVFYWTVHIARLDPRRAVGSPGARFVSTSGPLSNVRVK